MFRLSLDDNPLGFVARTLADGARSLAGRLALATGAGTGVGRAVLINSFAFWPPLGSPERKTRSALGFVYISYV